MSLKELQHLKNLSDEGNFRRKVEAILRDAKAHGYDLTIGSSLRTKAEQAEKVAKGYSKTMRSKHLPGWDGLARAADIVSSQLGWNAPQDYWIMVGRLALTKNLKWGGLYGLPRAQRKALVAFLTKPHSASDVFNPFEWRGKIGWDPAHLEL